MSFLFLFVLWVIWSGKVTMEIVLLGVLICAALYLFINRFMGYSLQAEQKMLRCCGRIFRYCLFLMAEIIKANLDTAKLILAFDTEPEPVLVRFKTDLCTSKGQVLLANSIPLTPGTLTVNLCNSELLVHCLDEDFSKGMEQSEFIVRIRELETAAGRRGDRYDS